MRTRREQKEALRQERIERERRRAEEATTYDPVLSPGRKLYEDWLWCKFVPPDDLWDRLDEEDRQAWERLAQQNG